MCLAQSPRRVVVMASGTGSLFEAIATGACSSPTGDVFADCGQHGRGYQVVGLVCDKPCPAVTVAERAGIDSRIVAFTDYEDRGEWDRALAAQVREFRPDIVVSAGFMRILGAAFVHEFAGVTLNTHPALLPAFPGAHAPRDALAAGVKVTGSTVHLVDEGVDTGPIVAQEPVRVAPGDTVDSLHERIKRVERELIVAVLNSADPCDPAAQLPLVPDR